MSYGPNYIITLSHYYYYYLTAIGLTPGGSSTHLHTNSTQNTENGAHITITRKRNWVVNWNGRAVPRLCDLYPGICLTTEEKSRKNLS
jgi:hypothetical protein